MKIHEYREMMKYLTRPKDKLSKEEKKKIVKDLYKKVEHTKSKPMGIVPYIQKMNFLYGNGEDPKEIDPREFEDIKKSLPVSEMVKKPKKKKESSWKYTSWADGQKDIEEMKIKDKAKKKIIKKTLITEKPKPTIQEQLDFQDHLNTLDPYWWIEDEEEPKPKVLIRKPRRTAQGIQTILNLHKKRT